MTKLRISPYAYPGLTVGNYQESELLNCISEYTNLPIEDITGNKRPRNYVEARMLYAFVSVRLFKKTTIATAAEMNRDHSTIIYQTQEFTNLVRHYADKTEWLVKFIRKYYPKYQILTEKLLA